MTERRYTRDVIRMPGERLDAMIQRFNKRVEVRAIIGESRRRSTFQSKRDRARHKESKRHIRERKRQKAQEAY